MNELQLTIEEMKLGYMEAKVQQMNPNVPDRDPDDHGYDTEDELFERLICLGASSGVANEFIMESLSARQRAEFWDYARVVNAHDYDGMTEREYITTFKREVYNHYLNQ
jgi:hypothetical protein